jgi:hypothetical protein
MSNTILLKRSDVPNSVPPSGNLVAGELALNFADGNLFFKDNLGNVELLVSNKFVSVTGNITANNVAANNSVAVGNTQIKWATATTTSNVNQSILTVTTSTTDFTAVEFLVKSLDETGNRYSVATIMAVTDGDSVNHNIFGVVNLGGTTGTFDVAVANSGNIVLQVTPSSANSTVWTTQYRLI